MQIYRDEEIKERKTSVFNSGIATMERIDSLLRRCANARMNNDFRNWKMLLDILYSELYPKLDDEGKNELSKSLNELNKILGTINNSGLLTPSSTNNLYGRLDKWELELRTYLDAHGFLTPDKDMDKQIIG